MIVVGLTGGIGSGKTTVSNEFENHGIDVIDADIAARAIMTAGAPVLLAIRDAFGSNALTDSGELNRPFLRDLVFSDNRARHTLDSITHPAIRLWMKAELAKSTSPYAILVIPLLNDRQMWDDLMDRVLVVDVDEATQIERVMARDNQTQEQAQNALASQISRQTRLSLADDVILNNRDLAYIREQVCALHQSYLTLSQNAPNHEA